MVMVRDRGVDPIAVERRPPIHAALVAARTKKRVPDELPAPRIEERVDAALAADPDDVTPVAVHPYPHHVHAGAAKVPFLAIGFGSAPSHDGRLIAARPKPGIVTLHSIRPPRLARLQIERHDGLQERARLLARFGEDAVSGMTRGHTRRFCIRLSERSVHE